MIEIIGPDWPSIRMLRQALAQVPESGRLQWANGHANKMEQLRLMRDAGIECPPFTTNFNEPWIDYRDNTGLWLGRKFHHKEGKDIVFPDNQRKWRVRDFWVKLVPSQEEWRIHVFNGKSIARSKKVQEELGEAIIRNHRNGWRFRHRFDPPKGMRAFAKKMVEACGYLYGACDILVKPDGGFCALEVNTCPAMDNYTLGRYVQAIRRRFQNAR